MTAYSATAVTPGDSYRTTVTARDQTWISDAAVPGGSAGPSPFDLLVAALASCKTMTVRAHAAKRGWAMESVSCTVRRGERDQDGTEVFHVLTRVEGDLDDVQRAELHRAADRCPVAKLVEGSVRFVRDAAD